MTLRSLGSRLAAAPPRTRALLVAGAGAAALLLAASGDPLLATAGRATAGVLALGTLGWWVRRRGVPAHAPALLQVAEQHPLSRDAAVALLRIRGRALLVGYGADGVRLLADLGVAEEEEGP